MLNSMNGNHTDSSLHSRQWNGAELTFSETKAILLQTIRHTIRVIMSLIEGLTTLNVLSIRNYWLMRRCQVSTDHPVL